jgi:hypothetical protein
VVDLVGVCKTCWKSPSCFLEHSLSAYKRRSTLYKFQGANRLSCFCDHVCVSFFYAHRKGQKKDPWLDDEITLFCNFSQHQDLLDFFFFPFFSLLSFCACVNFLTILTQLFFSTQKIFWPFTMELLIEEITRIHQILKYK